MTDAEVQKMIEEFHVPSHVRRHCEGVKNFALKVGKKLIDKGFDVDLEALSQAAQLHDLVRVVDFKVFSPEKFLDAFTEEDWATWEALREKYAGQHHADVCAQILQKRGYAKIAALVAAHRFLHIDIGFKLLEEKVLYYADKRVQHDKVVSLKDRLNDERWQSAPHNKNAEESERLKRKVFELEQELFEMMGEAV